MPGDMSIGVHAGGKSYGQEGTKKKLKPVAKLNHEKRAEVSIEGTARGRGVNLFSGLVYQLGKTRIGGFSRVSRSSS